MSFPIQTQGQFKPLVVFFREKLAMWVGVEKQSKVVKERKNCFVYSQQNKFCRTTPAYTNRDRGQITSDTLKGAEPQTRTEAVSRETGGTGERE